MDWQGMLGNTFLLTILGTWALCGLCHALRYRWQLRRMQHRCQEIAKRAAHEAFERAALWEGLRHARDAGVDWWAVDRVVTMVRTTLTDPAAIPWNYPEGEEPDMVSSGGLSRVIAEACFVAEDRVRVAMAEHLRDIPSSEPEQAAEPDEGQPMGEPVRRLRKVVRGNNVA